MNSKYKYAIGVEISLNMSPSLAGPPTGTLFQTIITAGRNFYLKLFKVEVLVAACDQETCVTLQINL